jgi:hypothetical protein
MFGGSEMPKCHCETHRWVLIDVFDDPCEKEATKDCPCCRLPTCSDHFANFVDGSLRCADCSTCEWPCYDGLEGVAREKANSELCQPYVISDTYYLDLKEAIPKIKAVLEKHGFDATCLNTVTFSGSKGEETKSGPGSRSLLYLNWWMEDGYHQLNAFLVEPSRFPQNK